MNEHPIYSKLLLAAVYLINLPCIAGSAHIFLKFCYYVGVAVLTTLYIINQYQIAAKNNKDATIVIIINKYFFRSFLKRRHRSNAVSKPKE